MPLNFSHVLCCLHCKLKLINWRDLKVEQDLWILVMHSWLDLYFISFISFFASSLLNIFNLCFSWIVLLTQVLKIISEIYILWHHNKTVWSEVFWDCGAYFRLEMDETINVTQGFSELTVVSDNSLLWETVLCVVDLAASLESTHQC